MMDIDTNDDTTQGLVPSSSLEAMLLQEKKGYQTRDYLYQAESQNSVPKGPLNTIEEDRSKMVAWMYQVADFCKFNRETVEIATSYFDRFMLSKDTAEEAMSNTDLFQLAAMTCFYTAAKITEPESFEPWMLSKMSRGLYSGDQVERMELVILRAINWRMNPPTVMAFVREFLALFPKKHLSEELKETVYDICKFQAELCVRIYQFVPIRASTIAVAALMNALESLGVDEGKLEFVESLISQRLKTMGDINSLGTDMDVKDRLYQAVTEYSGIHTEVSPSNNSSWTAKQHLTGQSGFVATTSPCAVMQQVYSSAA